jgi:DNA-binding transcriptional ArsR family regulator
MEPAGYLTMASNPLDATFAALADPTRRAILSRLASGEASVLELAEPFAMSQPAISKHLKVLERAGLISRGQDAQRRPRRLEARPLAAAAEWLENYRQFWEGRFQRLDALLDELKSNELRSLAAIGGRSRPPVHLADTPSTFGRIKENRPRKTGSRAPIKKRGDH